MRGLSAIGGPCRILCGSTAGAASPVSKPTHNKHTMKIDLLFIGLDVHAKTITVALAESGGEARLYGAITHDLHALDPASAR